MDLITSLVVGLFFALVTLVFALLDYCCKGCKEDNSSISDFHDGFEGSHGYETYPMILRRPMTNSDSEHNLNEELNENENDSSSECEAKTFETKVEVHKV